MTQDKTPNEPILWQLGTLDEVPYTSESAEPIPAGADLDALLRRYRAGELDDEQTAAVERRLGKDAAARTRLQTIAGQQATAVPAGARERFLRAAEAMSEATPPISESRTETDDQGGKLLAFPTRWAVPLALAAAVVLAVMLLPGRTPTMPAGLGFDVAATGLAEVRGDFEAGQQIQADADTVIKINATPTGAASNGVDFGLYRLSESGDGVALEAIAAELIRDRGAARFELEASEIADSDRATLILIVASHGDLPEPSSRSSAAQDLAALSSALRGDGRRQVYPITVEIVDGEL
jgi:hypothetical protein